MTRINPFSIKENPTVSSSQNHASMQQKIITQQTTPSNMGLTVEESNDTPLTEEEKQLKISTHQKEIDDIQRMKSLSSNNFEDKSKSNGTENINGLNEVKNLKDVSQMSKEEVLVELQEYGINIDTNNELKLRSELLAARENRFINDEHSNEIDGHIGTYVQGKSMYCTILSKLDTMSDEQIKSMITHKTNENGEKIYIITFPIDENTNNSVEVTEAELLSNQITITENNTPRIINDFPRGDLDVTLLTMAYVKRFGSNITDNGAWIFQTNNNFRTSEESQLYDNQYLEDMSIEELQQHSTICLLNLDEIQNKGIETHPLQNEDLSWIENKTYNIMARISEGCIITLSDGIKACISKHGIFLSNGTKISPGHAMAIRGYDESTKELIISGNEFNNATETRIPIELLRFMETASTKETAGVDKTPEPEI